MASIATQMQQAPVQRVHEGKLAIITGSAKSKVSISANVPFIGPSQLVLNLLTRLRYRRCHCEEPRS